MKVREKGDLNVRASLKGTMLEIRVRDHDRRVVVRVKKGSKYVGIEVSEKLRGSTAKHRARLNAEAWDRIVRAFNDAENSSDGVERFLEEIMSLVHGLGELLGICGVPITNDSYRAL